jgi:hypothetical protein
VILLVGVAAYLLAQKLFASSAVQGVVSALTPAPAATPGVTITGKSGSVSIPLPDFSALEAQFQSLGAGVVTRQSGAGTLIMRGQRIMAILPNGSS